MPSPAKVSLREIGSYPNQARKIAQNLKAEGEKPLSLEQGNAVVAQALTEIKAICDRMEDNVLLYASMLMTGKLVPVVFFEGFACRKTVRLWMAQGLRHDYFNGKLCVDPEQFFEFFYRTRGRQNPNLIRRDTKNHE